MIHLNLIDEGKKVFDIEIETLNQIKNNIDDKFVTLITMIMECTGRVIITGMGKSGHIGRKIAATMCSLGTPTYFLHPAEGLHGDLGRVTKDDIIIAMSNSGETDEILGLIPSIKEIGAKIVSLTGKEGSTLEQNADLSIVLPIIKEASAYNLAPTTSTTAMLVYGDAIAVVLSKLKDFRPENFALFHPNGALGKRLLLKVKNIMHSGDDNPVVQTSCNLNQAIYVMSSKGLGAVSVVDEENNLVGIITDGDLRRYIEKNMNNSGFLSVCVSEIMTLNPIYIEENQLAVQALDLMENRERQLMVLPVVNCDKKAVGMVRIHDIIKAGVVI